MKGVLFYLLCLGFFFSPTWVKEKPPFQHLDGPIEDGPGNHLPHCMTRDFRLLEPGERAIEAFSMSIHV